VIEDGLLRANVAFPGLEIRWSADGDPGPDSNLYEGPIEVTGEVHLATFDRRGRSSRVASARP
jgi:hexosaminidase